MNASERAQIERLDYLAQKAEEEIKRPKLPLLCPLLSIGRNHVHPTDRATWCECQGEDCAGWELCRNLASLPAALDRIADALENVAHNTAA